MKNSGILNAELTREIAALGHTNGLCIADCGLPIPKGVKTIDLAVAAGVPRFMDVLRAVHGELVVESYVLAAEISRKNAALEQETVEELSGLPCRYVSHEEFKEMTRDVKCVVRTGEVSPYANVILIGGVNF